MPFRRLVGFWAAFTVVVVAHTYVVLWTRGVPFQPSVAWGTLVNGLVWIGLTPLVARAARRFPVVGPRWHVHAALHALGALGANAAVAFVLAAGVAVFVGAPFGRTFVAELLTTFLFYAFVWGTVVALVHAVDAARQARERERWAGELEAQLARARLDALRAQLNPHFLFNTLNAVGTLMGRDVHAARAVLADLSDLLRLALDRMDAPEVPLDDELDFLRHYLRIEAVRFGDRLVTEEAVADGLGDALVPPLVLQPLVENALKHAVGPRAAGGRVAVSARRAPGAGGDVLVLRVEDDGPGLPGRPPDASARGLGLRTTRERIDKLYGARGTLRLLPSPAGGLAAEVRLPYHTVPLNP